MSDFTLSTSTGSKGYIATQSGYDECRRDIIMAARNNQDVRLDYSTLSKIESTSGRLPDDVRSRLGMQ